MHDPRLDKLARLLVRYSLGIKRDDVVSISGNPISQPLILCLYREVLGAGAHPWVRLFPDEIEELHLKYASDAQLVHTSPIDKHIMATVDARIGIWADMNSRALTSIPPGKQALRSRGRKPIMNLAMKRGGLPSNDPKRLRWCGTAYPTECSAQDAEMSLSEYEDFVFGAGKLNERDPIAAWKKLGVAQQRLADFLDGASEVRFRVPNGTDLRVGVKGRHWINCCGHENFPDGEVFSGPIENATEGTVVYQPPAVYGGREVTDIRLTFKAGRVVDCSASKNADFLVQMLDQDKGGRILGEIAIGTNYAIQQHTRNTLFDEKIGGTFHAALGAAYPETGGKNESGLHWDMVCDLRKGGTIEVDGKVISRNGKFTNAAWPR